MYSNIVIPRHWSKLARLCRYSTTIEGQKLPETSTYIDGISPPVSIPRGPTDILQALAGTLKPDPTAAHYKYHDDPYLIPLSNFHKRSYALSAEAGRKAAAWVRDEHAELFNTRVWDPPTRKITPHVNAEPAIDAYAPKPIYNDESKVTEDDFKYTIHNALVEDSVKVYELLGGSENLSEELKLSFLQLLCFYNEKEADSMEWLEERWYSVATRDRHIVSWKLGGLAEKMFTSMEPKSTEAYCSIIQGMAKYYQAERAHQLAQEAIENGIQLPTSVYNSLIMCIGFLCEGTALRLEKFDSMLVEMVDRIQYLFKIGSETAEGILMELSGIIGITPNAGTLTACLKSLSVWGSGNILQQKALQLLADFKVLNIEPSLAAYYYLLCLFCKERGPRIDILSCILDDLESRETLEATNPNDVNFFLNAMAVCNEHLEDMTLAERVHILLMRGNNYKLLGDAYKESIYYRHLITVACKRAPLERTLQLLDQLVPNVYVPEPSVMERIIQTLEVGGCGDRLAQVWSQLVVFDLAKRMNLVERLLSAMTNCYDFQDQEVKNKITTAAIAILKHGQDEEGDPMIKHRRTPPKRLSATALCNTLELVLEDGEKSGEFWTWVSKAIKQLQTGEAAGSPPKPEALAKVATKAASLGQPSIAASAVSCLAEYGFEEATSAALDTLGVILNRSRDEILAMLKEPRDVLTKNLDGSALALVDVYLMGDGVSIKHKRSRSDTSSSSDSDSESSDDDRSK